MTSNDALFASMVIANVESAIGRIEDASLTMLHLALAGQIDLMLRAGGDEHHVGAILEAVWQQLGERWASEGLPNQTHRNESAYVS